MPAPLKPELPICQDPTPNPLLIGLVIGVLGCLVWTVFFPVVTFEFIDFDTPTQVVDNPYIRGLSVDNLYYILTSRCITSYYPFRTLTYALDYQIWGLNPGGFKFTNGVIHSANVLLVFWLVLRLFDYADRNRGPREARRDVLVAAFVTGVFGIHPLVVEPVAWIPGREELLMTLGALGCMHFHITGRRLADSGGSRRLALASHLGAACCCLAACLSNAVGAVIALLIVVWDLLVLKPPRWRKILVATAPLGAISATIIVIKVLGYTQHPALEQAEAISAVVDQLGHGGDRPGGLPGLLEVGRLTLALKVYSVNLGTLAWPKNLAVSSLVTKPESLFETPVILGATAAGLTCAALWLLRRRKLALFGLLWFLLALAPVSQIVPYHILHADRFLYLPLVGLAVALAMIIRPAADALRRPVARWAAIASGTSVVLLLAGTAASHVRTWQNDLTLWEHCAGVFPESHLAHQKLADALVEGRQFDRAFYHYQKALELNTFDVRAASRFARALATCDDPGRRDYELAMRLADWAWELTQGNNAHVRRTLAMVHNNLAEEFRAKGEHTRAIEEYQEARRTDPNYASPLFNLALLSATSIDPKVQNAEEAVRLAEEACRIVGSPNPNHLMILAVAYAHAGRTDDAGSTTERAIRLAEAEGNLQLAGLLRERLELFRRATAAPSRRPSDQ